MTDRDQIHPRWGRPLDQYVHSWGIDSVQTRANWDAQAESEVRNRARVAICGICDLAGEKNQVENRVTLPMLQSVMDLTLSPGTFSELGYPGLVDGCIKLMELGTVPVANMTIPFRYEYGYLCFRILTLALDVCFLQRANLFDATIARMRVEPGTSLLLVLSQEVSKLLNSWISDDEGIDRLDWLLGLRAPKHPNSLPQRPFTTVHGPLKLLNLLCSNPKYFSKAFDSTYSPGLSLVFCLLWRYVQLCDDRVIENRDPYLKSMLSQMYFRYCLVAPPCDDPCLVSMYNRDASWWAAARQAHIDDEDERLNTLTYIGRFSPANTCWLSQPSIFLVPILLQFLLSRVPDGVEDLLPRLFGLTIDRLWEAHLNKEASFDKFLVISANTMCYLGRALDCLKEKSYSDEQVISDILDALIHHDLFDFIAQVAFLLPVRPNDLPPEEDPNKIFINQSVWMWEFVGKILPKEQLRSKFQAIVPDLRKYIAYTILWMYLRKGSTDCEQRFRLMSQSIVSIGYIVGLQGELDVRQRTGFCNYERCHDPVQWELIQFACDGCGVSYCGKTCQAKDWMYGSMRKWHKISCGKVLPLNPHIPWSLVDRVTRALTEGPNPFPIERLMH